MKTIILTLMLFFLPACINSQIVINEIMYSPQDASNEWFEIFNASSSAVNIQNWKWKDATSSLRTITAQSIILDSNAYAIVCQDSVKFKLQFNNFSGRLLQTVWSQLNNSGDNLILIDNSNSRIDSVSFSSSWGGGGGVSLERIDPLGESNSASNWSSSLALIHATPGTQNSVTPKPHDLFLKSLSISPLFPSAHQPVNFTFVIQNKGLNPADNFSFNLYEDINSDSVAQSTELIETSSYASLNVNDSIQHHYSIQSVDTGSNTFIASIVYQNDNDTLNNRIIRKIYVSNTSGEGNGIVINEIMYDPLSNQSEWIEFYNATGQQVNIKGWQYKENTTSISLSDSDLILNPNHYLILARDTTIFQRFDYLRTLQLNQIIKFSSELSLNNSGEYISLTDSIGNVIDELTYDPDWNNPEISDSKGISLERLNPVFGSNDNSNWSSSANILGGTPGMQNSIYIKNISPGSSATVTPNPFSPDNDGFEDFALIKYKLEIPFGQMRVKVFDIKGRLVRTLANNDVTGSEGTIIFNGLNDNNEKLRIGIYILLIEAVDSKAGTVNAIKAPLVIAGKM